MGKISGKVGNIYKIWFVFNYNIVVLKILKIIKYKDFGCMDVCSLVVEVVFMILLFSGERMDGLGSKWVMWRLLGNREKEKFWNYVIGKFVV